MTSTPTSPVDNVIATKGLQDRNINILAETTVENKGKLILTEIFPSVQKHDIFLVLIGTIGRDKLLERKTQAFLN